MLQGDHLPACDGPQPSALPPRPRRRYRAWLIEPVLFALLFAVTPTVSAQGLSLAFTPVATDLVRPVLVVDPGDGSGRLFLVQQTGQILVRDSTGVLATPFLDIGSQVSCCGEQGLLGLAFHPNYASNGLFYVDYTDVAGDTVVAEYQVSAGDPDIADPASARVLLTVAQPYANHNGGNLAFGPDGYLYIGFGDGGSGGDPLGNGQNLETLLGSILRIDVDAADPGLEYAIPADNPFAGNPTARHEIWAWGLRNPWRFSFDRATGDLFIGDVGQSAVEEIDFQDAASPGGENYGWSIMEGSTCYGGGVDCNDGSLVLPILEYGHDVGSAVTGGYRYRGSSQPRLRGMYLYADYGSGLVWGTVPRCDAQWQSEVLADTPYAISTFGEGADGELYLTDYAATGGTVYHVTVAAGGPALASTPTTVDFGALHLGVAGSAELLLTNTNTGPEAVLVEAVSVSDTIHFSLNADGGSSPCGSLTPCLGPGESCTVEVRFSSGTQGTFDGALTISGNHAPVAVPLTAVAYEPCSLTDDRTLPDQTVSDTRTEAACLSLTAGPYGVVAPGDVTFLAGTVITLANGFAVGPGATFTAAIDPLLALP